KSFREPRLIVVTDPRVDHQAIREASYVNIPVIAFCDTDAPLKYVDVVIPTNNKAKHSIGLVWWLLCREVLRLKGQVPRTKEGWSVMVDMFFYRDPDEIDKEQEDARLAKEQAALGGETAGVADWDVQGGVTGVMAAAQEGALDWSADPGEPAAGAADWSAEPAGGSWDAGANAPSWG
ncbi:structural constituent of ribosome, partial [Tulasnella sp. 403]